HKSGVSVSFYFTATYTVPACCAALIPVLLLCAVTVSSMRPDFSVNQYRLLVISLAVLAVILLTVNIGLGVYYSKLTGGYLVTDINRELAKLQKIYNQMVQGKEEAQKQLVKEMSDHQFTKWEMEHQIRRTKDYQKQIDKIQTDVSALRSHLPLIKDGCRHCLPGWTYMESTCFYFAISESHSSRTWYSAQSFCKAYKADLAIINSREKQLAVFNLINNYHDPSRPRDQTGLWTGRTDQDQEGVWKWVDGTRLSEGYWRVGEPNNQQNEDCAAVYPADNPFQSWNDAPCRYSLKWICEMEPKSSS
uniref:C-type lectin domain-containing protein n=1 Tax=Salarias fasciatus TaxID=181472 RepID=A0A672FVN6_SALFA